VKKWVFGLVFILIANSACVAQRLQWQAFKLTEENDFFSLTQRGLDQYYTQGLRVEFLYTTRDRKFTEKILVAASPTARNQYTLGIAQQIYAPRNKDTYTFIGDMPYSGILFLSQKLDSYDSAKHVRFTSRLDAGLIGPAALGEHTQGFFHRIINNDPAVAWDTQLRNDILLNYSIRAEKRLAQLGALTIEGKAEANAGTLLVSGMAGVNLKVGMWQRPEKFSWEIFFLPEVRAVAYHALLQGGVFNRLKASDKYSQYFLDEIKPTVYSHSTGFQVRFSRWELLYRQVNVTREFMGQSPHYYGTVTLTFWFRKNFPPQW
jgi:lipid A 3-O-deacylase